MLNLFVTTVCRRQDNLPVQIGILHTLVISISPTHCFSKMNHFHTLFLHFICGFIRTVLNDHYEKLEMASGRFTYLPPFLPLRNAFFAFNKRQVETQGHPDVAHGFTIQDWHG